MSRHVLIAFDESAQSQLALEHALELYTDATITVIHVNDPREWIADGDEFDSFPSEGMYDRIQESAQGVLERAEEIAATYDREIQTAVVAGRPSDEIVDYARTHDVDHILVGSHGRTGLERFLIGSVAERVVRGSPVPVTVMRKSEE